MAGSRRTEIDPLLVSELERYQRNGGRVVTIGQDWLDGARAVTIDNRGAGHQLIRALIDDGQTRFAFLGGPSDLVTSLERRAGFRIALEEVGLEPVLEMEHAFTSEGGYSSVRDLLSQTSADDLAGMAERWERSQRSAIPA